MICNRLYNIIPRNITGKIHFHHRRMFNATPTKSFLKNLQLMSDDPNNNVTQRIVDHVGSNLLHRKNHPLQIIKNRIFQHFSENFLGKDGKPVFKLVDDLYPVVTAQQCFDDLLIPKDHVSRSITDTFYVSKDILLRTHTSAHQTELMRSGERAFLCAGDVYRRDEIDQSHYPVFHQMEGVYIFDDESITTDQAEQHLKETLEGLVKTIFGDVKIRWVPGFFPFTDPSLEVEIWYNDEWLEVLGCGVIHTKIMENCNLGHKKGWAFGLGLERLAMILFNIPDIRLFWSQDPRFIEQFTDGQITEFKPYSKYPPCMKDISFWIPDGYHENDFYSVVGDIGKELIERVEVIDIFVHPKTERTSMCYRVTFRSMDRSLTNAEIDDLQSEIRERVVEKLGVELR